MSALLEVRNIYKNFYKDNKVIKVLSDINLKIEECEKVAIVGRSGAGKTTLLHLLGTLETPTSGNIIFDGIDITNLAEDELAAFRVNRIGFVFQFHYLINEFSAFENVIIPAVINGEKNVAHVRERADYLLNKLGLFERKTHRPSELSGGEQQRLAIARALINTPKILMADEPTGNLDTKTTETTFELLEKLHEEIGMTILMVTHNQEIAEKLHRRIILEDGKIIN